MKNFIEGGAGGGISVFALKKVLAIFAISILLTSAFYAGYVSAPSGTTNTITQGVYGGAPSYTIWRDGATYYAKTAYGAIDYSGTNFSQVFNNAIDGLPTVNVKLPDVGGTIVSVPHGTFYLPKGTYNLNAPIMIPLGSRLIIKGEGTTQQMHRSGIQGGTQIHNLVSSSAVIAETTGNITGTEMYIEDIEFVQEVDLATATTPVLNLDGFSQGALVNVQVTGDYDLAHPPSSPIKISGVAIQHNQGVADLGSYITYDQVIIESFTTGLVGRLDHFVARQMGIGRVDLALKLNLSLATSFHDLHLFEADRILEAYGGFATYGSMYIYGLYLESSGNSTDGIAEWTIDESYEGHIRILKTNANECASTIWNGTSGTYATIQLWWEDVRTMGSTPPFPTVVSPSVEHLVDKQNIFMQVVEVYVTGGTVNTIWLNGLDTGLKNGTFSLRPADYLKLDYSVAPTWVWRAVSADVYRNTDLYP